MSGPLAVTWRDRPRRPTFGFRSIAGVRGRPSPGSQPGREVPDDHVRRADIESFARDLEGRGRARATVTRWLRTIAGFYKYAVEEELMDHSPAAGQSSRYQGARSALVGDAPRSQGKREPPIWRLEQPRRSAASGMRGWSI